MRNILFILRRKSKRFRRKSKTLREAVAKLRVPVCGSNDLEILDLKERNAIQTDADTSDVVPLNR